MTKEKNVSFVSEVRKKIQSFLGLGKEKKTSELRSDYGWPLGVVYGDKWGGWYVDLSRATRVQKYNQYEFLDKNVAEAGAVLNVYSDNIVSGTVGGDETYYVVIDDDTPDVNELIEVIEKTERRTHIKDQVWEIARNLIRDGDEFAEIVVAKENNKEYFIDKLKILPKRQIEADVDEFGSFRDPDFPYIQRLGSSFGRPATVKFDWWRIVHFKLGNDVYGVNHSIFSNAALRIARQLFWLDEALVLARMSRAWKRVAFLIETGAMSPDDAWEFVDRFRNRLKTKVTIDRATGKSSVIDTPYVMPDEDLFIPVGDATRSKVEEISGDPNVGNIADILYLQDKFFMVTTVPKAYVAKEQDVRARATLGHIDIQFARQVRRRQQALIPGLRKFYEIAFILAGKDPYSFNWSIVFPELATMDELIKWEIMQLKASVAKTLVVDIGAVNTMWVLKELLGFDNKEIEEYGVVISPGEKEGQIPLPSETAMLIRRDPQLRAMLDDLRDLVDWKISRDKELEGKIVVGRERNVGYRD